MTRRVDDVEELTFFKNYNILFDQTVVVYGYEVMGVSKGGTSFEAVATPDGEGDYRVTASPEVTVTQVEGVRTTVTQEVRHVADVTASSGGARDARVSPGRLGQFELRTTTALGKEAPTPSAKLAKAFLASPKFRGAVALLQFQNARIAVAKAWSAPDVKSVVSMVGVLAEFTEAGIYLADVLMKRRGGEGIVAGNTSVMRFLGVAGAGITAGVSAADAYERYWEEDYDAMLAFGGAAVAYTGLTVAIYAGIASGPVGWFCALAGFGLTYLAYVFTDDPILAFFKRIIFSDRKAFPTKGDQPTWSYNAMIYGERLDYLPEGQAMIGYVETDEVLAKLYDLLVASEVAFDPTGLTRETSATTEDWRGNSASIVTRDTGYALGFNVSVAFRQFLRAPEPFESEAYYYHYGIRAGGPKRLTYLAEKCVRPGGEGVAPRLEQQLTLPKHLVDTAGPDACILYLCRLRIDAHGYYPLSYCRDERWVGAVINVQQVRDNDRNVTGGLPARAAAKADLLDGSAWRTND